MHLLLTAEVPALDREGHRDAADQRGPGHHQDLAQAALHHHGAVVAEHERHHEAREADLAGVDGRRHRVALGNAGAGIGRQRDRRRNGGQAGKVEHEQMRDQSREVLIGSYQFRRKHVSQHRDQSRRQDGRADDVRRSRRQAHAQDDAGDGRKQQSQEQVAARGIHHGVAEFSAQTGPGDHGHDDTGAGAARHDGQGIKAGFHQCGRDLLDREAFLLIDQHDDRYGSGADQSRQRRGVLGNQKSPDQHGDDDQIHPAVLHDVAGLRDLILRHQLDVTDLALGKYGDAGAEEVQYGGNDGALNDGRIRFVRERDHQEGAGAHNGRQDLSAGRSHRFYAGSEFRLVAAGLHERDGEGAGTDDVGDGGTVDAAHQRRGHDRGKRGAAAQLAGQGKRQVIDELGAAGGFQEGAEHDEHEDNAGGDRNGCAEDAVQVDGHVLEQLL